MRKLGVSKVRLPIIDKAIAMIEYDTMYQHTKIREQLEELHLPGCCLN